MSMTTAEKIAYMQPILDDPEATDALLASYLKTAEAWVNARRFPMGNKPATLVGVEERFEIIQCEKAMRLFLRRGGQGEQIHNENGIHRHYGSVDDEDLLKLIPQVIRL